MRYLADILTFARFILATILLFLAFLNGSAEAAFLVFFAGVLTDVFDGTCAKTWPFPKNKIPKYRKYAPLYDMISDVFLAAAQVLFVAIRVNWIYGLVIIFFYLFICIPIDLIVYGKLLGHPDDCTKNSLTNRNFPLAKKIILARRAFYTLSIGATNAVILFATNWPDWLKYLGLAAGCLTFIFAWFFLRQRRKNITRNAVELEKQLTKKAKK